MIGALLPRKPRIMLRLQLQFFSRCCVGISCCNGIPFCCRISFQNLICNSCVSNGTFLASAGPLRKKTWLEAHADECNLAAGDIRALLWDSSKAECSRACLPSDHIVHGRGHVANARAMLLGHTENSTLFGKHIPPSQTLRERTQPNIKSLGGRLSWDCGGAENGERENRALVIWSCFSLVIVL